MKKATRETLLDSAYRAFYKQGFQGANIASILNDVGINKGSMYHFFKSKKDLGLAVVKERIERQLVEKYAAIPTVKALFDTLCDAPTTLPYGCPLNKISQEMRYIDADFQRVLSEAYATFERVVREILEREGIAESQLKARQIIATYEGALMIYHLDGERESFEHVLRGLETML